LRSKREGRQLSHGEFAALCKDGKKPIDGDYLKNIEEGVTKPGRRLLEKVAAAAGAGFTFEDCLSLPVERPLPSHKKREIAQFTAFLNDWREPYARESLHELEIMKKPKREKTGGRTRKQSE
jgi:transcriptional regulator with XRE-family HTH domain